MRTNYFLVCMLFVGALLSVSCSSSENENRGLVKEITSSFNDDSSIWTYVSLENGKIVGSSKFGDNEADNEWKNRTDWDIAFSGDLIKTNGGTSGKANCAIQKISDSYETVDVAPVEGYIEDAFE